MADKTVRIGVDNSEVNRAEASLRKNTEDLARDMIKSSRQYSTSAKEVLKDLESQIKAIERRNKLDEEFRRSRLESLRERGGISDSQLVGQRAQIAKESRQDAIQIRLLRELIDTVKVTSKDEIREDRKNVERRISESKTVGRLGVDRGKEFEALKESIQQDILSDLNQSEVIQRGGFSLNKYAGMTESTLRNLASGNVGGIAMGASRSLMAGAGAGGLMAGGFLAILAAAAMGNKRAYSEARDFAITNQMSGQGLFDISNVYGGYAPSLGMNRYKLMNFSSQMQRALGGREVNAETAAGLAGITRSTAVSPELLSQTLAFQRYSSTGSNITVVNAFENALKRIYPDEFRRKLIQLPEMMGVFNNLAQTMVQTTGYVNTKALSGFVGGVREGFGVEGTNLQRYAAGFLRGFTGSPNDFIRKMQFSSMRQAYGNISYQQTLERLENPTSSPEYMRVMFNSMKRLGLTPFRSWMQSMGFGARESREAFESGDFSKVIDSMKMGTNKTVPDQKEVLHQYFKEAQKYYSNVEKLEEQLIDFFHKILTKMGATMEDDVKNGTIKAMKETGQSYGYPGAYGFSQNFGPKK